MSLREERVQELGESAYKELKELFCRLKGVKELVGEIHGAYVERGTPPAFEKVEALQLMVEGLFAGLERYIMPECDPDSAYPPAMPEKQEERQEEES